MTAERKVVASWGLLGVIPVKWSGPGLNLDSPKVATETLELAHHGFTDAKPIAMSQPVALDELRRRRRGVSAPSPSGRQHRARRWRRRP